MHPNTSMREAGIQSQAQTSLPTAKITRHPMRNRKIDTVRSLCFLNSLKPSLIRVGRRRSIERTKRKIGIAAATKAIILKIIAYSFSLLLQAGGITFVRLSDRQGGRNTEDMFRERRQDQRDCTACHQPGAFANEVSRKANFDGIDVSKVTNLYGTGMTWEFVDRLRATVKGKLVLKGIMTGEDAKEALRHGVDGLIAVAPRASAFRTLVPRRTPPSMSTGTLPPTASTTSTSTPIVACPRRRALGEHGLLRRRLELEHVQRIARRGDDAVRAERSRSAAQHVVALREPLGYLQSGVDGDVTRDANYTAYAKLQHPRPAPDRRAQDRHERVKIFGETWGSPIFCCPVSSLGAYNPEAGVAVARAAGIETSSKRMSSARAPGVGRIQHEPGGPAALFTSAMLALSTVERIIWCLRLASESDTAT